MSWLALLKKQTASDVGATKPTKPQEVGRGSGFVGFVACPPESSQTIDADKDSANDAQADILAANPDRCYWPHSNAMNGLEIDTLMARVVRFTNRGLSLDGAERLADKLVTRDREGDDRRVCLECIHLQGVRRWRCANALQADVAQEQLATELVSTLQRCCGYRAASPICP